MISSPYEGVSLNVQNGVVDCTDAPTQTLVVGGDNLFVHTGANSTLTFVDPQMETVLHIDVDKDGVVPMVVKEHGYEWTPVYTRKLT